MGLTGGFIIGRTIASVIWGAYFRVNLYKKISISRSFKGNENRFKQSGLREIEGKIIDMLIQGKQPLVRDIGRFEKLRVREIGIPLFLGGLIIGTLQY